MYVNVGTLDSKHPRLATTHAQQNQAFHEACGPLAMLASANRLETRTQQA